MVFFIPECTQKILPSRGFVKLAHRVFEGVAKLACAENSFSNLFVEGRYTCELK